MQPPATDSHRLRPKKNADSIRQTSTAMSYIGTDPSTCCTAGGFWTPESQRGRSEIQCLSISGWVDVPSTGGQDDRRWSGGRRTFASALTGWTSARATTAAGASGTWRQRKSARSIASARLLEGQTHICCLSMVVWMKVLLKLGSNLDSPVALLCGLRARVMLA